MKTKCSIHGDNCPGDDGGFLIDGNHPDDMYPTLPECSCEKSKEACPLHGIAASLERENEFFRKNK